MNHIPPRDFFSFFFNIAEGRLLTGPSPPISFGPRSHPSLSGEHTRRRKGRGEKKRREEQRDGGGGRRSVRNGSQKKTQLGPQRAAVNVAAAQSQQPDVSCRDGRCYPRRGVGGVGWGWGGGGGGMKTLSLKLQPYVQARLKLAGKR